MSAPLFPLWQVDRREYDAVCAYLGITPRDHIYDALATHLAEAPFRVAAPEGLFDRLAERALTPWTIARLDLATRLFAPGHPIRHVLNGTIALHEVDGDGYPELAARNLSLAEMIQLTALPRDQSRSPLFVAAFEHREGWTPPAFGRLRTYALEIPACGARYDLALSFVHGEGEACLECDFSTELFAPQTVAAWLRGLRALLEHGVDQPQSPCGSLDMVGRADRETLLVGWNRTECADAADQTVLELFQRQVEARPRADAIRCRDVVWSYGELGQRVDALAGRLSPGFAVGKMFDAVQVVGKDANLQTFAAPTLKNERMRGGVD